MADSLLASGDLLIDRLTEAGVSTGFSYAGNAIKLEIQAESDLKEQEGRGRTTYGQVIASVNIAKPHKLKISLNQLDRETLAIAFLGTQAAMTAAAGSLTAHEITAIHDKYVETGKLNLSNVVVKNDGATVTYTVNTDYVVNERMGMIMALSTGTITDGQKIEITADYAAESGYRVKGAVQPTVRMGFRLDGKNLVNGKDVKVFVWQAQVKPSSPVDFLADDFSALELEGTMVTPTGKDSPYYVEER